MLMNNYNYYTRENIEKEYKNTIINKILQPGYETELNTTAINRFEEIESQAQKFEPQKFEPQKFELNQKNRDRIIVSLAVVGRASIQGIQEHIESIYGVKVLRLMQNDQQYPTNRDRKKISRSVTEREQRLREIENINY